MVMRAKGKQILPQTSPLSKRNKGQAPQNSDANTVFWSNPNVVMITLVCKAVEPIFASSFKLWNEIMFFNANSTSASIQFHLCILI